VLSLRAYPLPYIHIEPGGSATVDQTATTGVSVTVSGSSLEDGTSLTVSTMNYDTNQPEGTGTVLASGAIFFDVQVTPDSGVPLGSDVNVTVSITDASITSSSVMMYWNGLNWVLASHIQFIAPNTLSGTIPASALTGTPIGIGNPSLFTVPEYALGGLLALLVCFVAFIIFKSQKRLPKFHPHTCKNKT
jgi:hypothetical protein